jgi:hypothetical protein
MPTRGDHDDDHHDDHRRRPAATPNQRPTAHVKQ